MIYAVSHGHKPAAAIWILRAGVNQSVGRVNLFDRSLATHRFYQWEPRNGGGLYFNRAWMLQGLMHCFWSRISIAGPQLLFAELIAMSVLKLLNTIIMQFIGYKGSLFVCHEISYDGLNHLIKELETKYHRCKNCDDRTNLSCSKCHIPLHPKCIIRKCYDITSGR